MLTDTTFWVDLLQERRNQRRGPATMFLASHRNSNLAISIITWGELAMGFRTPDALDDLLRKIRVISLHKQVAWEAGRIERELSDRGGKLGENDNWIAATARVWGLRLLTQDAAFDRVPGIIVIKY